MLWPGLSMAILIVTYIRFNFERFFAGRRDKAVADELSPRSNVALKTPVLNFAGDYNRRTLGSLIRLELLNIIRDNYFWMIIGCGTFFLGFVFWMGPMEYGIRDLPRTVMFLAIFSDAFPFFIFFIIMFYCGETLQRDRLTRYSYINDALPPPNWVLNGSKLISLLILSIGLAFLPVVVGVAVQLLKGYPHLNLSAYLEYLSVILLPKFLTGAVLCYVIQVIFNNKFALAMRSWSRFGWGCSSWIRRAPSITDCCCIRLRRTPGSPIWMGWAIWCGRSPGMILTG